MSRALPGPFSKSLPILLPIIAIAGARMLTYSAWAAENPGWAAGIFAWIVCDAILLAVLAKAPRHRPEGFELVAALSLASIVILIGASPAISDVYFGLPQVLAAAGGTLAIFLGWSALRIVSAFRRTGSLLAGMEAVLPPILVRHVSSEVKVLVLALFRWGAPVDVPRGMRAFAYHTYLTPMIATFLVLQIIEMAVVHLLLMFWVPTFAWVLLGLSVWGVIWTIALLKSFRIKPVLMGEGVVRVRSGMVYDFAVPLDNIAAANRPYSSEELEDKAVLNLAIMSAPNVSLRFDKPVAIPTFFGGERLIEGVGLKLDDSAGFLAALEGQN